MASTSPNFARTCDPVFKASLFPERASTLIHLLLSSRKPDRPVNVAGHRVNGLMAENAL